MNSEFNYQLKQNENLRHNYQYYKDTALILSDIMENTAHQKYNAGEIGFIEYSTLLDKAMSLRINYISAKELLNINIIELNYLMAQ